MNITVDFRSVNTSKHSGVEQFILQTTELLFSQDKSNRYTLYSNGFKAKSTDRFNFINVDQKRTTLPSRVLNLSLGLFGYPKFEQLVPNTELFYMPNPNPWALKTSTKLVIVVHDLSPIEMPEMYSLKARLWHKLINLPSLVKRADKIIAVSNFTKQSLISQFKLNPDKIVVSLLGVDHQIFHNNLDIYKKRSLRNRYNLPGKFVLFIGTLEPRKNITRLIEAFEQLPGDYSLVISGKLGWKYKEIFEKINSSSAKKRIIYLGYVSEVDKPYLLSLASVLAWPSLYEGFGLPPLEAMAVGTPVLTSSLTSLPEVVSNSALMVDPYNVPDIRDGLLMLLTEQSVRKLYIEKGLLQAKQFSWQKTVDVIKQQLH